MATPSVRRSENQSGKAKAQGITKSLPLTTRRIAAWAVEFTLVVASGLVPYGIGAYANSRSDLDRVTLNPILVETERAIARPLALPISYGTRNVAWPTNFLWTVAVLVPLTLSGWQLYLLAKTGSTIPKRWFAIRVVSPEGRSPGFGPVLVREGIGRWAIPMSVTYILWRYSFLFPNIAAFTTLAIAALLLEGTGFPWQQDRRALHDRLAGTYTIDANKPFVPLAPKENKQPQPQWTDGDEEAAIASVVITPEQPRHPDKVWEWMRQNPSQTLVGIALISMSAVLATLIGTQVYIQNLQNQRATEQRNSEQFITLRKQLSRDSGASQEERRNAILALGTLNDPQATRYLVDLLVKETNPALVDTIQQALVGIGLKALPDLKRTNQFLMSDRQDGSVNQSQASGARVKQLQSNQQAINKILAAYSGQVDGLDLSNVNLGPTGNNDSFNLELEKADLWGIKFRAANLSSGNFKGSRFRGAGEDGRWDTFDDAITDLSLVRMTQANLTEANLSRVLLVRTDLSRATLNKANLSNARLSGANLSSAQLMGADLSGAVLQNASLTGADLGDAKLTEVDMYAARLGRVIAIGAQLSFANLMKTDWQGADLTGAYLDRANLSDANLSATRLTGAILRSANLVNANLRNSDLSLVDFRGANLKGADFQGAILSPSKQDPTDQFVQTPSLGTQSSLVDGVDFTEVKNLDPKQIAYICTQGGIHRSCP
ncbi:MAG: pentapeptide repeat-containing protein [Scytonema sp. PMC 1069.18]|nr:pentapeptide repeat-containing protein [Scytonema sp. PMC 1069.18]MEC4887368.1 pentapeptide repeat-containing protein [Scytonema sp. PMC 1070.18]